MNNINGKGGSFSNESFADALQIWNRSAISLIDIRHKLISPDDALRKYRMPASMFVYTSGAKSEVSLDDTTYYVERFGLFHGGKGTEISIIPKSGWLEYYMVFYKAGESPFHKREFKRLMEKTNPFLQQYGFAPKNPLFFGEQLRKMFERWKGPTPLNLFYGKTAFYQLVYEVYEELDKGNVDILSPDIVSMVKRYVNQNYSKTVSIHSLSDDLGISNSQISRLFKREIGCSPQEYLMDIRLSSVRKHLLTSDATLKEIARNTGFYDEYYLGKAFKNKYGQSPHAFRVNITSEMREYSIGNIISFPYNGLDQVSLGKLDKKEKKICLNK